MRIGVVTHAFYPHYGGVTEHVAGSTAALRARGHRVTVVTAGPPTPGAPPWLVRLGRQCLVPCHGATVNVTFGAGLRRRLAALFNDHQFDVVHVHCPLVPMLPLAAVRAASDLGMPVVGTFHATARWGPGYQLFGRWLRADFDRLDRKVAVSVPARDFVGRYFPGRYELIPNGVDPRRFSPAVPAVAGGKTPTIVYVGRLDPRKGVRYLIEAMTRVTRSIPGARLLVVGDGPERRPLARLARRVEASRIEFRGAVLPSELPSCYAGADVICSPATHNESFGIVLLEAMATGKPVVATRISGYAQLIEDGVSGKLVEPRDPEALAVALIRILRDPGAASRMGQAGLERSRVFSWPWIAGRLETLYRELAGGEERWSEALPLPATRLEPVP